MAPLPEESVCIANSTMESKHFGDKIVISGISGTFPECADVIDYAKVLYDKEDPVAKSKPRFTQKHPEVPGYAGSVPDLDRFDAQFFKVNSHLARHMDPMSRLVLEHSFKALYDAGVSPAQLAGRNIGVYMGMSLAEAEKIFFYVSDMSHSNLPGCSKAMFANRISYWLDVHGPSMMIDDSCCSALAALEQAFLALKRGDCEAALVGGANIGLHINSFIHYGRLIPLCKDGKTKSFDENADGCVKSEAASVVYLQKAEDAKRIYAELVNVKNAFGGAPVEGGKLDGFKRNPDRLAAFIGSVYQESGVSPSDVQYVEAFGSADPVADKAELQAIAKVFCKDRDTPLAVGSVTSNIGYTEAASGLAAIVKVLLSYRTGKVPATLHCVQPRRDISDQLRIATDHVPLSREAYTAINSVSITGVNAHVLLKGWNIPKPPSPKLSFPYLVNISARNESAVQKIIDELKSKPMDQEQLALLGGISETKVSGHLGRGFAVLDTNASGEIVSLAESAEFFDDLQRPLWFVYSGMGSQWAGMGAHLMRIPAFAAAIQRCDKALAPKGIDIVNIITANDKTMFDNILHSFVGIAAIQIGLTDVLYEIGIVPDNIIGHSVGELGCGYADGCLTAEEMILAAYYRGLVSVQTPFIRGSMAAVGLGYSQVASMCPPEVEVACHNGPESATLSGPAEAMQQFVSQLTAQGVFAKEVPCSNIAYHSRYIADAGPKLLEHLSAVIKTPRRRSARWVSTSVPQERWGEERTQLCSAWYQTNNLLSPVLFEETSRLVPPGAVLVEVAPHGLLQAILKRSLPADCRHIPLTKRNHADNTLFLLQAVGKLFLEGYQPKVAKLYPAVQYPVSSETPMLSHLVEWNHVDKWPLPLMNAITKEPTSVCKFHVSLHDPETSFLRGHTVRGRQVYPFSGALVAVWDTFAMVEGVPRGSLSVEFKDVHLTVQPLLLDRRATLVRVSLHRGTGEFEVTDGISKLASGVIVKLDKDHELLELGDVDESEMSLDADTVYDILEEREYSYSGDFRSIYKTNPAFTEAQILWKENWISFIDGALQLNTLHQDYCSVTLPQHVHRLVINVKEHTDAQSQCSKIGGIVAYNAKLSPTFSSTRCGGVTIEKIVFRDSPPPETAKLQLQTLDEAPSSESYSPLEGAVGAESGVTLRGRGGALRWEEAPPAPHSLHDITVRVRYVGLNTFDVKLATGVVTTRKGYSTPDTYGMDYSGTTIFGENVMGVVRGGAARGAVRAAPRLLWPAPAHWSLAEAASVPFAYAQAFYCLGIKAQLQPGMSILVHGGCGALGQAAISIALAHQCRVFATVSDARKRDMLLRIFPQLSASEVGNSRSPSFGDMVLRATAGRGCDIVLSCVPENLKNTTLKCASYCGITFDMTGAYHHQGFSFGMHHLTKQRTYVVVNSFVIFEDEEVAKSIQAMVSEGIARGYVRPVTGVSLPARAAARALRHLAAGRHVGRVLLRLRDDIIPAQPRVECSPDAQQLVVSWEARAGGRLLEALVARGARRLALAAAPPPPLLRHKIMTWQSQGVQISTHSEDVRDPASLAQLLSAHSYEGIYVVAREDIVVSTVLSTLDQLSRKLCPSLKYFALISSDESSPMDELFVARRKDGLPATKLCIPPSLLSGGSAEAPPAAVRDAVERALAAARRSLRLRPLPAAPRSFRADLQDIAELTVPSDAAADRTLRELGLNAASLPALAACLRDRYHVSLTEPQIYNMTVDTVKAIEASQWEPAWAAARGLGKFLGRVDADEYIATAAFVVLPTLVRSLVVNEDEVDLSQPYLWLVPGAEGHHARASALAARLKMAALALQPAPRTGETVADTATRCIQTLSKRAGLGERPYFHLLGYEGGVLLALEIAAALERDGYTGTVFCVGGMPEEIILMLKDNLKDYETDTELQDAIIKHMAALMTNGADFDMTPFAKLSWREKIERTAEELSKNVAYTKAYMRIVIESAFVSLKQIINHDTLVYNLKSRIVLIRTSSTKNIKVLKDVKVSALYELDVGIEHALDHPKCATIVNSELGEDILNAYDALNHCQLSCPDEDTVLATFYQSGSGSGD